MKGPPLQREHRLYEADWLLRFYGFGVDELVSGEHPDLDLEIDPKTAYALRNPALYPVDVNRADYGLLLRVPGIGQKSARMIIEARRHARIRADHLKSFGVVMKRARYFITCNELTAGGSVQELQPERVRSLILSGRAAPVPVQLSLFSPDLQPALP